MQDEHKKPKGKRGRPKGRKLTPGQRAFVEHLAADPKRNAAKAARDAGYAHKSAQQMGSKFLNDPHYAHVKAEYERLRDERMARHTTVPEGHYEKLMVALAFGDRRGITKVVDGVLQVADSDTLEEWEEWMIDSYKLIPKNDGSGEMLAVPKLVDRLAAAKALLKMKGLLAHRYEAKVDITLDVRESLKSKIARLVEPGDAGQILAEPE